VGVGDPLGMAITHAIASGLGGMRTAGDLVARMQMTRSMKIREAKEYVARKLGVAIIDLSDPLRMTEVRDEFGLGLVTPLPKRPIGIESKFRISEVLGIEINSVNRFRQKTIIKK